MSIPKPHDALCKEFLTDITVARDFFEQHLPATIKPYCDLSTLRIQPTVFVDDDLRQHTADILYSLKINGKTGYIYTLIEHASQSDPLAAWRLLRYSVGAMKQHMAQHEKETTLTAGHPAAILPRANESIPVQQLDL